jgi:ABC-type uncharacterized transport system YnjBCD permease subunit
MGIVWGVQLSHVRATFLAFASAIVVSTSQYALVIHGLITILATVAVFFRSASDRRGAHSRTLGSCGDSGDFPLKYRHGELGSPCV